MNKTVLKEFAIESRKDLMDRISLKLKLFYLDENFDFNQNGDVYVLSNNSHTLNLSKEEYQKRELLLKRKNEIGIDRVIEESAYTWFNRLVAIRYMEVNDYLPLGKNNESLGLRVLSSNDNTPNPEILKFSNLINNQLDIGFKQEVYSQFSNENEKYKYILQLICNKLKVVFPEVFDGQTDYIDLLIPENMLNETGFISKLVTKVEEDDFKKVEILGWLYQYYNQTEKDRVMASKKAYKEEEIPYATELFTPDWIVKYMVENTIGSYMKEHGNDDSILDFLGNYIHDNQIKFNNRVDLTNIKFIDPCCGSGHILVYAFSIFYKLYESQGYNKKDIPELILKNNLYGLDVDDRAGQLSILSLILKAREYDKDLFNKMIIQDLNVMAIQNSKQLDISMLKDDKTKDLISYLTDKFEHGKELGSLIEIIPDNYDYIFTKLENNIFDNIIRDEMKKIIKQAKILSTKYEMVVTNPPYMTNSIMPKALKDYVGKKFADSKKDLCTCFMETNLLDTNGYMGMINQQGWLSLTSYEKLRAKLLDTKTIISALHLGPRAFDDIGGEVVQTVSFVLKNNKINNYKSKFIKLTEEQSSNLKYNKFIENKNNNSYFEVNQEFFKLIPGGIFAYWLDDKVFNSFDKNTKLSDFGDARQGLATSDNNLFLRLWQEVEYENIGFNYSSVDETVGSKHRWFPYNKGGGIRKWSPISEYVVNYEDDGHDIKEKVMEKYPYLNNPGFVVKNTNTYFKSGLTWNDVSTGMFCCRLIPDGYIYDAAGPMYFSDIDNRILLGYFNSNVFQLFADVICQGLHYSTGQIPLIPYINNMSDTDKNRIIELVDENMKLSYKDWNNYESSWDFDKHPYLKYGYNTIKECYQKYDEDCKERFFKLKSNEEELNQIFMNIYNLNDKLKKDVDEKNITVHMASELEDLKSLIIYSIGCIFGRYSLDFDKLQCASNEIDLSKYNKFIPDKDNIVPIVESNQIYFDDDLYIKFKKFISVAFGDENIDENMEYIALILGKKGTENYEDTIRRYFVNNLYSDICSKYSTVGSGKRPIYWQIDSGKNNGFKSLIYIHRYDKQLLSKIRVNYLHKTIDSYTRIKDELIYKLDNANLSPIERKNNQFI